jgi:molecular chaperone Hsp33
VEGEGNLEREHREDEIGLNEAFNRIAHLVSTLTNEELLTLDADIILRRLFWEEDLRRFEPLAPRFACTCSRDRVRGMLRGLGREEVQSILAERGDVEIGCEFCGTQYRFDVVDVGDVFTPPEQRVPGSGSLN